MAKARKKKRVVRTAKRRPAKRKPAKRKVKRKVGARKPSKRSTPRKKASKRRRTGKKVIKQVEKRSVERVMAGKRRRSTRRKKRAVRMAGTSRRRSVGKKGSNTLLYLGLGAAAVYLLTRNQGTSYTQYPGGYTLPAITQTSNYTRNSQSQDIVNYAIAAGLAVNAITSLIEKLNGSTDAQVQNTYDVLQTTGNLNYIA